MTLIPSSKQDRPFFSARAVEDLKSTNQQRLCVSKSKVLIGIKVTKASPGTYSKSGLNLRNLARLLLNFAHSPISKCWQFPAAGWWWNVEKTSLTSTVSPFALRHKNLRPQILLFQTLENAANVQFSRLHRWFSEVNWQLLSIIIINITWTYRPILCFFTRKMG